jgi:peroxiredoxin family protein
MNGFAVVLASEDLEKLTAASTIASVAAASDVPVEIFVTMNALRAFEHETVETRSFEAGAVGQAMLTREDVQIPLFVDQLRDAKELGPISLYACTMAMEMMGRTLDDYVDVFDEEMGVAGFLNHAMDKQVMFI